MSKGVGFMLLATFFFSVMNVCVKLLPHIPPAEIVFFRSVISFVISLSILKVGKVPIWGNNKKILILRGLAGSLSLILYFQLIQDIPLASATTILFLAPIFTTIIGIFFVKEKVYGLQWIFITLAFAGILVIKGFDMRIGILYLVLGIAASLFSGLAHNCIRKLNTSEHPLVIIFYFPLITLPFTGIWSVFKWVQPHQWDWLYLLLVGLLTQAAQYFMTRSYQFEEISKVAGLRYLGIIYAITFGYFVFDETYGIWVYIGMTLTILGVVLNIWYKHARLHSDREIYTGKLMN